MTNFLLYGFIAVIFYLCVIFPEASYAPEWLAQFNLTYYGILHLPSLVFILLSAVLLYLAKTGYWSKQKQSVPVIYDTADFLSVNKSLNQLLEMDMLDDRFYRQVQQLEAEEPLFREIIKLLKNAPIEDDIQAFLAKKVGRRLHILQGDYQEAGYLASFLPLLGMIGTVAGLMMMFSNPDDLDDFSKKFSGLSLALMTTLYATLITALIFKPMQKIASRKINELEHQEEQLLYNINLLNNLVDLQAYSDYLGQDDDSLFAKKTST